MTIGSTASGGLGNAPAPTFSPAAGTYVATQNVAIACTAGSPYYQVGGRNTHGLLYNDHRGSRGEHQCGLLWNSAQHHPDNR